MTKTQMLLLALRETGKHVARRWYMYGTFLVIFMAPLPVILVVAVGWLGYFNYRVLTLPKKRIHFSYA